MTYRILAICFSFTLGFTIVAIMPLSGGVLVAAVLVAFALGWLSTYLDLKD